MLARVIVAAFAALVLLAGSAYLAEASLTKLEPRTAATALLSAGKAVSKGGNIKKECRTFGLKRANCKSLAKFLKLTMTAAEGHPAVVEAISEMEGHPVSQRRLKRNMAASSKAIDQLVKMLQHGPGAVDDLQPLQAALLDSAPKARHYIKRGLQDPSASDDEEWHDTVVEPASNELQLDAEQPKVEELKDHIDSTIEAITSALQDHSDERPASGSENDRITRATSRGAAGESEFDRMMRNAHLNMGGGPRNLVWGGINPMGGMMGMGMGMNPMGMGMGMNPMGMNPLSWSMGPTGTEGMEWGAETCNEIARQFHESHQLEERKPQHSRFKWLLDSIPRALSNISAGDLAVAVAVTLAVWVFFHAVQAGSALASASREL